MRVLSRRLNARDKGKRASVAEGIMAPMDVARHFPDEVAQRLHEIKVSPELVDLDNIRSSGQISDDEFFDYITFTPEMSEARRATNELVETIIRQMTESGKIERALRATMTRDLRGCNNLDDNSGIIGLMNLINNYCLIFREENVSTATNYLINEFREKLWERTMVAVLQIHEKLTRNNLIFCLTGQNNLTRLFQHIGSFKDPESTKMDGLKIVRRIARTILPAFLTTAALMDEKLTEIAAALPADDALDGEEAQRRRDELELLSLDRQVEMGGFERPNYSIQFNRPNGESRGRTMLYSCDGKLFINPVPQARLAEDGEELSQKSHIPFAIERATGRVLLTGTELSLTALMHGKLGAKLSALILKEAHTYLSGAEEAPDNVELNPPPGLVAERIGDEVDQVMGGEGEGVRDEALGNGTRRPRLKAKERAVATRHIRLGELGNVSGSQLFDAIEKLIGAPVYGGKHPIFLSSRTGNRAPVPKHGSTPLAPDTIHQILGQLGISRNELKMALS